VSACTTAPRLQVACRHVRHGHSGIARQESAPTLRKRAFTQGNPGSGVAIGGPCEWLGARSPTHVRNQQQNKPHIPDRTAAANSCMYTSKCWSRWPAGTVAHIVCCGMHSHSYKRTPSTDLCTLRGAVAQSICGMNHTVRQTWLDHSTQLRSRTHD
jgi:hypothetical protein